MPNHKAMGLSNRPTQLSLQAQWLNRFPRFTSEYVWVLPLLLILLLVNIFPLAYSLYLSLQRWNLISNVREFIGLKNFIDLLTSDFLYQVVRTTLIYTGSSVVVQLILGFMLALAVNTALERELPFIGSLRVMLMIPMTISPLLAGFYFKLLYSPQFGAINQILRTFGLPEPLWAHDPKLALMSLVIADTWLWLPFVFTLLLSGLRTFPKDVLEAAAIDGANRLQVLRYVTIPMMMPIILVVMLMRTIDSIKYLDLIYIITRGGPGAATEILAFYTYRTGFNDFEMGLSSAIAYLELICILALVIVLLRITSRSGSNVGD
ncbi:MAG: sugar ABC transporter permease [Anaerolineae bacterium]